MLQASRQLWRRIVFNLLSTNVDDHLQNLGFLHVSNAQWRLAPAFDLNPFPDKDRESKTWLSADAGPAMRPWACSAMSWTTSPQRSSMRNWTPHASYWGEKAE